MEFEYTLDKEEYLDYWKYQMLGEPTFKRLRHRCWFILPLGLVLLLVILFPAPWWAYVLAGAASLLWVLLVNRLVAGAMAKAARQRRDQAGDDAYRPLRLELRDGTLRVNGQRKGLENYRIFSNLLLLFLTDGSCVLLPQRVFGTGQEEFRQVVVQLDRCLKKK